MSEAAQPRIAWPVLFLRALGLIAARHSGLRQSFVRWPWPHLIESTTVVGVLAIAREHEGRDRLCWASFQNPDQRQLTEMNGHLGWYRTKPVEQAFEKQVRLSRLPTAVRRLIWWWNLSVAGKRASRLGTFSISSLAASSR